jgi:hypothetical protein
MRTARPFDIQASASCRRKRQEKKAMSIRVRLCLFAVPAVVLLAGLASAQQYPILDRVAQKVIEKYQNSSCEQLAQKRGQPPSPQAQRVIRFMRSDPQMRTYFINQVAGPIANKLFDCGLIP